MKARRFDSCEWGFDQFNLNYLGMNYGGYKRRMIDGQSRLKRKGGMIDLGRIRYGGLSSCGNLCIFRYQVHGNFADFMAPDTRLRHLHLHQRLVQDRPQGSITDGELQFQDPKP